MAILEVDSLRKQYRSVQAVRDVSFEVTEGEIFGMIGPNGAGKTTTIECCLGLRTPSGGRVRLLGMDPQADRRRLFREVGVQLQETSYQEQVRVGEICRAISSLYEEPVDWRGILERFGLADKVAAKVSSLSGGQRQRLTIALALIPGPRIVFLDELTTGLDPRARREMWSDIRALRDDGMTIFMTTHYMEEAEHLCDRVAVMSGGRLLALDTVEALIAEADLSHEISFESPGVGPADLTRLAGVREVDTDPDRIILHCDSQHVLAELIRYLDGHGHEYRNVRTKSPGLDELFLYLTARTEDE